MFSKPSYCSSIRTTYCLRIREHSSTSFINTYLPSFHLTNASFIAYIILFISQYILRYISVSLVQLSSLPSLSNHASHLLSTSILRPSKMNNQTLSFIGPNLWNSLSLSIIYNTYIDCI